ncbi:MAG: hypothetical protein SGI77_22950 [Pirellulaceae bacterium]|nr:hypothetical protein [Pirellulaceae bacterium]
MKRRSVLLCLLFLVPECGCGTSNRMVTSGRPFDSVQWKQQTDESKANVRLDMADQLVAQRLLDGRTRMQVIDVLGEPLTPDFFNEWEMVYWLGPERKVFSLDSEWLAINLDTSGIVSEYRVIHD